VGENIMTREEYLIIQKSSLFMGIEEQELESMLKCLSAVRKKYQKGEFILRFGDLVDSVGMVISGGANILQEDCWGNRNIIAAADPGQTFAESYACMQGQVLGVGVQAVQTSDILFLNIRRILQNCSSSCQFHTRLIQNLLILVAGKNLQLNEKLAHLSRRTTREKLFSYLSSEAIRQSGRIFEIPFNRQQLADYLSVDRSAMSGELSKMRKEGILDFDRNRFTIKRGLS